MSLFTSLVSVAPRRSRMKTSGLRLGKTLSNRSPKTSRLNPVGGESTAAPSSRQNPGFWPPPSEQQTGHPERGLADERAADRGVDVIVQGRRRGLAGGLPEQAAAQAVGQRPPEVESGRPREAEVDVALVGMAELVDAERISVDHQRVGQVVADRLEVGPVLLGVDEVPVDLVEPEEEAADLEGRNHVALALAGLPVELGRLRESRRRREQSQDQQGDEGSHASRPARWGSWASSRATRSAASRAAGTGCRSSPVRPRRPASRTRGRPPPASAATR